MLLKYFHDWISIKLTLQITLQFIESDVITVQLQTVLILNKYNH